MSEPLPPPLASLPSGNDPALLPYLPKWNWGAALMQWVWAYAHRLYGVGTMVLVANLLGLWLITVPVLGLMGNDLAWRHCPFASYEEFERVQRYWTRLGVWLTIVGAILLAIFMVVAMALLHRYFAELFDLSTQVGP